MFQHVAKYSQHMFVLLLDMLGLKLINQQMVEKKLEFFKTCENTNPKTIVGGTRQV